MSGGTGQTQVCSKCKIEKPVEGFSPRRRLRSGYNSWCKSCNNESGRRLMVKGRKLETYKISHREGQRKYVANNPEKDRAHRLARYHKEKLLKAECEQCGAAGKLHMHHPDYSKPLEVMTLCISCHELIHHGASL